MVLVSIKQIVLNDGIVLGLGVDEMVYQWDYNNKEWKPYWNTIPPEDRKAQVFYGVEHHYPNNNR